VPMSIHNSFNKGFKYEVALNFPIVKESENQTSYGDTRKYGTTYEVKIDKLIFCICYMYSTPYYRRGTNDFVKYDSLERCLEEVLIKYKDKKIAAPLLGVDKFDGNGNREKIVAIFQGVFNNKNVTLYDWKQCDYSKDLFVEIASLHKLIKEHTITPKEYLKKRSEIEWRRRYGIFKGKPEDYLYIPRKGEIESNKLDLTCNGKNKDNFKQ
jgi:hypothetical protein